MNNRRITLLIEAVVIIAVVLLIAVFASQKSWAPRTNPAPGAGTSGVAAFPADIPMQSSGPVTASSAATPAGQLQALRSFLSAQTADANFTFYKQALSAAKGWTVLAQVSQPGDPGHKAILARNGEGMLTINITKQTSSTSLVAMVFVSNPAGEQ